MEEIPDEIHDIQDIKRVLAENGESNKCKVWLNYKEHKNILKIINIFQLKELYSKKIGLK